jgi:hypothetical protein
MKGVRNIPRYTRFSIWSNTSCAPVHQYKVSAGANPWPGRRTTAKKLIYIRKAARNRTKDGEHNVAQMGVFIIYMIGSNI